MRTGFALLLLLGLALAGCGLAATDTAEMPLDAHGAPVMTQNEAIGLAAWVLENPAVAQDKPALAARAVAATDWLAGQEFLTGGLDTYSPARVVYWQILRREIRTWLGVRPGTTSQEVVDALFAASAALARHDDAKARAALQAPGFSLGAERTLATLSHLPRFAGTVRAFTDLMTAPLQMEPSSGR
ncbi:MAG TPA: hypothetical protein VME92_20655 [Acetobacteraceae bacterium]|nr:hypothetical protein [Acetobacteraceae bacterium]